MYSAGSAVWYSDMFSAHPSTTLPALTGVRAIAVVMVFVHHHGPSVHWLEQPFVQAAIGQLYTGVTLFFVLSGFLITYRYFDLPGTSVKCFLARRFGRIVPLYVLLTTLTFVSSWVTKGTSASSLALIYLANITFVRGWFEDLWASGILQGWSLTVEMTFYLLALPIFWIIRWRTLAIIFLPVLLLSTGMLLVLWVDGMAPLGFMGSFPFLFGITFFGRCSEFFVGVALAMWFRSNNKERVGQRFTYSGVLISILVLVAQALIGGGFYATTGVILNNVILPIGIALFFYGSLTEKTVMSRVLSSVPMQFLGRTSYAFYLIHMGVVFSAVYALTNSLAASFILLQLGAWLLYQFMERPVYDRIKRRFPLPGS